MSIAAGVLKWWYSCGFMGKKW